MKKARFTHQLHRREAKARRRRARNAARACTVAALAGGALAATGGTAEAAFPGTPGLIAFDSLRAAGGQDIWTVNPNVADPPPTQADISDSPTGVDVNPTWSANGQKVAFVSTRIGDPGAEIYVMDANGANQQRITSTPGENAGEPSWSPDGRYIAFAKGGGVSLPGVPAARDIWVVNVNGTVHTERQVTTDMADDNNPTWSPDGRYIAFESSRLPSASTYDVWRVNASGTESSPVDLTPGTPDSNEVEPDYSPGSSWILLASDRTNPAYDVYVKAASTSSTTIRLTTSQGNTPGWSPDGRRFTFASNRETVPNLYDIFVQRLAPEGMTGVSATNVTSNPGQDQHPDWQPLNGMCPTPPAGSPDPVPDLPPLPVDPSYPLSTGDITAEVANTGGAADNDGANGGTSDGGEPHPGGVSSQGGGTGNPCPPGGGGGGAGSSDHGDTGGGGGTHGS